MPAPDPLAPHGADTPIALQHRAGELDALGAILPAGARDRLAGLLTPTDVATLRHVAERGIGANTLRALTSDLGYLEGWCAAATGRPLPWPAPRELLLKFVGQHLWNPTEKDRDAAHGMPEDVRAALTAAGLLRTSGPHAPATVRRRLASWATLTAWRDLDGAFGDHAFKKALRLAVRGQDRGRHRHSTAAVTRRVLDAVLAPLDRVAEARMPDDRAGRAAVLRAARDRTLLSAGFAAGGRRRSEIAGLHTRRIGWPTPEAGASARPVARIALGRTKTTDAADGVAVTIAGRAAGNLAAWLAMAGIGAGWVFPAIDRWGHMASHPISPQSVTHILRRRLAEAGVEAADYSAHGLRSGFMTEAALQGLSLQEAMAQSGHRSATQAAAYYTAAKAETGRAAQLLE